jgi:plasmid replication initiation protein
MQKFYIAPTKTTFEILFDPQNHNLQISGVSYPSDALSFFQPILEYITKMLCKMSYEEILIDFKVQYLNTSSSKYLYEILELFEKYYKNGGKVRLQWHHPKGDDELLDIWNEYAIDLNIPYEIITVN